MEEWLESADATAQWLAEPTYLEHVRPDALASVDFSRSHMLLAEEHVVFGRWLTICPENGCGPPGRAGRSRHACRLTVT